MSGIVLHALSKYEAALEAGALMVIDETKMRLRMLPLTR